MTAHDTHLALAVERHDAQASQTDLTSDPRDEAMDRMVHDWAATRALTPERNDVGYRTDGPYELAAIAADVVLELIAHHLDARAADLPIGLVRAGWQDAANAVRDLIPTTPEGHAA